MIYKSLEEYVIRNTSRPCAQVYRNYEIFKARESGLTLQQIAIKFSLTKQGVIKILSKK
jgi:hypothetical protein